MRISLNSIVLVKYRWNSIELNDARAGNSMEWWIGSDVIDIEVWLVGIELNARNSKPSERSGKGNETETEERWGLVPGSHFGMTFQVPLLHVTVEWPWVGSYSWVHSSVRFSLCSTKVPTPIAGTSGAVPFDCDSPGSKVTFFRTPFSTMGTTHEAVAKQTHQHTWWN